MTPEKRTFLQEDLVSQAFEFFERALRVRRAGGFKSMVNVTDLACGLPIPSSMKMDRSDADLIVLVTAFPTEPTTLAWAITCFMGGPFNR